MNACYVYCVYVAAIEFSHRFIESNRIESER